MYVPSTRKIISSYDVVFDESVSSALAYTSQPYPEAMDIRLSVTYITCATYLREQTGDIITFENFEERKLFLKIVSMLKALTNTMTIQSCHHYLAKKK